MDNAVLNPEQFLKYFLSCGDLETEFFENKVFMQGKNTLGVL